MSQVLVTVEGLDQTIEAEQGFKTVQRYIEEATQKSTRLELKTGTGRVSILPTQVLLLEEIKGENDTETDADADTGSGPFNT